MRDLSPTDQDRRPWNTALICGLRQVAAAVTSRWALDEVLTTILDACSAGLGFLYPSLALLDLEGDRLVGRLVSLPRTQESIRRVAEQEGLPLDGFLGPRNERRATTCRGEGSCNLSPDALSYRMDMTENRLVRVFLERTADITQCYYDIVRPYVGLEDAIKVQHVLGVESIVLLPLLASEQCLGVIIMACSPFYSANELDLATLGLFAGQAAMAIENTRLHRDLSDREQQVSFLLKATIDAQEEERERICLEIHDGVAQTLAPAFHYLQTLDNRPELPADLRASMRKAGMLVRNAIREAREVIATLRPAALDTLGLVSTLRYELQDLQAQAGCRVDFDADHVRFPKTVETALYRIIHEAVTNVTKHAQAKHVTVQVKQLDGRIIAEIRDDGVGFDLPVLERNLHRKGVGLLSMRKRTELLNGSFRLTSKPDGGTLVRVDVPLLVHEGQQGGSAS